MDIYWLVIGLGLSVMIYGAPIALAGLIWGIDPASPLMRPPIPPTLEQSKHFARDRERRARYFEDCQ
jgi:hypothetical protein